MYVQISEEAAYSKVFSVVFIEAMLPLASMQDLFICSWTLRCEVNKQTKIIYSMLLLECSRNQQTMHLNLLVIHTKETNTNLSKFLTVGRSTNQPKFHPYSLEWLALEIVSSVWTNKFTYDTSTLLELLDAVRNTHFTNIQIIPKLCAIVFPLELQLNIKRVRLLWLICVQITALK